MNRLKTELRLPPPDVCYKRSSVFIFVKCLCCIVLAAWYGTEGPLPLSALLCVCASSQVCLNPAT